MAEWSKWTNVLTKFNEEINSRPLAAMFVNIPVPSIFELIQDIIKTNVLSKRNAPPSGAPVFEPTRAICELAQDIIKPNLLTKSHKNWTMNLAQEFFFTAPPPWRPCFSTNQNHDKTRPFGTNLLTKFHEDRRLNVASRVKDSPPTDCHIFQPTRTVFLLIKDIIGTHLLTKFNDDRKLNVASRVFTMQMLALNDAQRTAHSRRT
ncbi:hypothetical protein DPMN_006211 [Dreissena polymorpha]|uniref:Uncharacterized protein n=1 Tax=Dreissena polymorpha TaxID=45954 RepID=A0A9D4MR19_DREPO|nr:hypothetical protein DPMN_006211 [Dreissena polymorpha]